MNEKLYLQIGIGGITSPAQAFDITANDVVEDAIAEAIPLIDAMDAAPGNGKADFPVAIKTKFGTIRATITLDVA